MDVTAIIWFIIAHVAFMIVSKFILRKISLVFYLLVIVLFLIFFYGISLNDIGYFTSAVVTRFWPLG